jgi:hypothetical protein
MVNGRRNYASIQTALQKKSRQTRKGRNALNARKGSWFSGRVFTAHFWDATSIQNAVILKKYKYFFKLENIKFSSIEKGLEKLDIFYSFFYIIICVD